MLLDQTLLLFGLCLTRCRIPKKHIQVRKSLPKLFRKIRLTTATRLYEQPQVVSNLPNGSNRGVRFQMNGGTEDIAERTFPNTDRV